MSIAINSNPERDQLVASFPGQTVFTYSFPIFSGNYLRVYQTLAGAVPDDVNDILVFGVDYSVTGVGAEAGGTIVLTVGAAINDVITIVGAEPIERTSVFSDLNPFTVALNQQLNEQTVMAQQSYTYWNDMTPHYNYSELVSKSNNVRPQKLILPMLPAGHVWVGRGSIGVVPDDITTQDLTSAGIGNVVAAAPGMRQSIAQWTGTDFILTDSNVEILGDQFTPSAGVGTTGTAGFTDSWAGFHWPARTTATRPAAPVNGDTYYDTTLQQFFGYQNGVWVAFSAGASANVAKTITQATAGLAIGNYMRINAAGVYVKAQADTAQNAELAGLITSIIDANHFTLTMVGYIDAGVFAGLTPGSIYFLSDVALGAHTLVEPSNLTTISLPVFYAESATTGWLRHYRGIINGGSPAVTPATPVSNIITVTQATAGLAVENVMYLSAANTYAKAKADALATASAVGIIIEIIDANTFVLQTSGYQSGYITGKADATVYYLSPITAGLMTLTKPTTVGQFIKQIYISNTASTGYIQETQPEEILAPAGSGTGWTLISTYTVGAPQATVDIINITGYYRYMFVLENVIPSVDGSFLLMRTSADNGGTFAAAAADYYYGAPYNAPGYYGVDNAMRIDSNVGTSNVVNRGGLSGFVKTINPANVTYYKTFQFETHHVASVSPIISSGSSFAGMRHDTAIINAARFLFYSGNIVAGTFKLYGTNV